MASSLINRDAVRDETFLPGQIFVFGDLIFDGFEPQPGAPHCHDGHDLALSSDNAQSVAPVSVRTINSEPMAGDESQGSATRLS